MLSQNAFIGRSVLPHGKNGTAIFVPQEVRRDVGIAPGDAVDMEYDRERATLTIHFPE